MNEALSTNDDALAVEAATSRRALSTLISRNAHRIANYARRSSGRHWYTADRPDIKQQARLGVCTAVQKFDPKRAKFWTYAQHWIRHEVTRWLAYCGAPVHCPAAEFSLSDQPQFGTFEDDLMSYDRTSAANELLDVPAATRIAFAAMNGGVPSAYAVKPGRVVIARLPISTAQLNLWRNHGSNDCKK